MFERRYSRAALFIALPICLLTAQDRRGGASDPGVRPGAPGAGLPVAGLTAGQQAMFLVAKEVFNELAFVQNPPPDGDAGLGPGFNSDSCGSCHAFPAAGGSSPVVNPQVAVASKMGARNVVPPFITRNGPVLEVRFKQNRDGTPDGGVHNLFVITGRSDAGGCNARQEDFSNLRNLSFRTVTPVFGTGLMEAISDTTLRQNLASNRFAKERLGISGRFNESGNDGTITRFGWKAQNNSLHIFAGEAYNVESGITNHLFPQERDETPGCTFGASPEDSLDFDSGGTDDIGLFATFMRFLAPPQPVPPSSSIAEGRALFASTGCVLCHTASLRTGRSSVVALANKDANLFSDLALHKMGPGLADDISQGVAGGDEFRTAPLWGLGQRIFFLHDGRTKDLVDAIHVHASPGNRQYAASEANQTVQNFDNLRDSDQQKILDFLRSL